MRKEYPLSLLPTTVVIAACGLVLIAVLLATLARDRTSREVRSLRATVQMTSDSIDGAMASLRRDFREDIRLSVEADGLGLESVLADCDRLDYHEAILDGRQLTVLLNDGRTWVSAHRGQLRRRLQDANKETTVILIHPDSPMLEVLARKGNVDAEMLHSRIMETISMLRSEKAESRGQLEVLGHFLFNPHSLILTEERAISIPYFVSRGGRMVPAFVFKNTGRPDCHYAALQADIEALRIDCESLIPSAGGLSGVLELRRERM